jgi:hypothetical protein
VEEVENWKTGKVSPKYGGGISNLLVPVFRFFVVLPFSVALLVAPLIAQQRPAPEVPKPIVRYLATEGTDPGLVDVSFVDLNRDNGLEAVVTGRFGPRGFCGNVNCRYWVIGEAPNGYRLLLDAGSVEQLEPRATLTNGYRDIVTTRHDFAFDYTIIHHQFDGTLYRAHECLERHFDSTDNGSSRTRISKSPVETHVPC